MPAAAAAPHQLNGCSDMLGLQEFRAASNYINGTIPNSMGYLPFITTVDMSFNPITCCQNSEEMDTASQIQDKIQSNVATPADFRNVGCNASDLAGTNLSQALLPPFLFFNEVNATPTSPRSPRTTGVNTYTWKPNLSIDYTEIV
jgi:hypothetical protein